MKIAVLFYLLTLSLLVNAQELKRITKSNMHFGEIYYVLKNSGSIRQGQYLKYFESMNMYDKAIESFGSYDNNKRAGTWIFCDAESTSNFLISYGEFKDDKKNGFWVFFYEPELVNKHTSVILPTKENEQFNVTLDTTGLRTAATGEYINDKKIGIWTYYFKNGSLAYKYDFSSNSIIQNNGLENYDQLGGIERFKALFHKSAFEKRIKSQPFFSENSSVAFELTTSHDSVDVKILNSTGSAFFPKTMKNIIVKMPSDWINYDPRLEENKIKIYINYIVQDNIGTIFLDSIKPFK